MRTRLLVLAAATTLLGGGAAVAVAAPPQVALDASDGAAEAAAANARDLTAQIDEAGAPQGRGSEAFARRHRDLAAKHAEHPGNAAAVHEALADGESPSTVNGSSERGNSANAPGQARRAEVHALNEARKALRDADE